MKKKKTLITLSVVLVIVVGVVLYSYIPVPLIKDVSTTNIVSITMYIQLYDDSDLNRLLENFDQDHDESHIAIKGGPNGSRWARLFYSDVSEEQQKEIVAFLSTYKQRWNLLDGKGPRKYVSGVDMWMILHSTVTGMQTILLGESQYYNDGDRGPRHEIINGEKIEATIRDMLGLDTE